MTVVSIDTHQDFPVADQQLPELQVTARVLVMNQGMYIFRHASDLPPEQQVFISVQQAPLGKGSIDFFPAEGVVRNTLARLGDCLVARVKGDAVSILVTEHRVAGSTPVAVDLRIDRIDTTANIVRRPIAVLAPDAPPADCGTRPPRLATPDAAPNTVIAFPSAFGKPSPLRLSGHVERRGDVASVGSWLGDPRGKRRLEGFTIEWPNKPEDVDLACSCRHAGGDPRPPVATGEFCGTRGEASAIVAVKLGLVGPGQNDFLLNGQVVFAGVPAQDIVNGQEISGPTGLEQLVAIKVSISQRSEAHALPPNVSPWEDPAKPKNYQAS